MHKYLVASANRIAIRKRPRTTVARHCHTKKVLSVSQESPRIRLGHHVTAAYYSSVKQTVSVHALDEIGARTRKALEVEEIPFHPTASSTSDNDASSKANVRLSNLRNDTGAVSATAFKSTLNRKQVGSHTCVTPQPGVENTSSVLETSQLQALPEIVEKQAHVNTKPDSQQLQELPAPHSSKKTDNQAVREQKQSSQYSSTDHNQSFKERFKVKLVHFYDFVLSYRDGIVVFAQEVRVATRLARRVYWERNRYSRREKMQLKQSASDLAKLLPITSMLMVFGLEISTFAILRYLPGLMPTALRRKIEPKAQKLGIAPEEGTRGHDRAMEKIRIVSQVGEFTKAMAKREIEIHGEHSNAGLAAVIEFIERLEDSEVKTTVDDVIAIAPAFRQHMTMDKLPKAQLVELAALHTPLFTNRYTPRRLLALRLRRHVQRIREDDKEIHWEGIPNLTDNEVIEACESRGLHRGATLDLDRESPLLLRQRLETWLKLSLNREIPSSLLLVSCAMMIKDDGLIGSKSLPGFSGLADVQLGVLMKRRDECLTKVEEANNELLEVEQEIEMLREVTEQEHEMLHSSQHIEFSTPDSIPTTLYGQRHREAEILRASFSQAQLNAGIEHDRPIPIGHQVIKALEGAVIQTYGSGPSPDEVAKLLPSIDHDKDGCIDFVDFANAYEALMKRQEEQGMLHQRRAALQSLEEMLKQ